MLWYSLNSIKFVGSICDKASFNTRFLGISISFSQRQTLYFVDFAISWSFFFHIDDLVLRVHIGALDQAKKQVIVQISACVSYNHISTHLSGGFTSSINQSS